MSGATPGATPSVTADPGPEKGLGVFSTAAASGKPSGKGTVRRYTVQVEKGTGVPHVT